MAETLMIYSSRDADAYADRVRGHLPRVKILVGRSPEEAEAQIEAIDTLLCWRFPTPLLAKARRLKWVQSTGAGIEDLVGAPLPLGCQLTRVEGLFSTYISEYTFGHMLAHTQQLRTVYANEAERAWRPFQVGKLAGKRLGIAGLGSIGLAIARMGKAFGMEVWALVRDPRQADGVDRLFLPSEAPGFTRNVDYLVSTLPHTAETTGLIDPLGMKPGALLINVGRGATIDEQAILRAVREGRIQAVLDVFAQEPLPADHPFWSTPGITVTPHISGPSVPDEVADYFVANYALYQAGKPLRGLVKRERGY
jgi:glyoxylate/hydroxypyruvate reductase A